MRVRTIALVGCVKTKRPGVRPARDLYASPLFRYRRAYVEAAGTGWYILSAKHHLLDPGEPVDRYDRTLNEMSAADRRVWGRTVVAQLRDRLGDLGHVDFEIHAGARYVEAIADGLRAAGASVRVPTAGRSLGQQLAWYRSRVPALEAGTAR
ncbi:MAG: DUF6884 domain-containing protein [Chloroflexota bacterium]